MDIWRALKHFKPHENWGNSKKINGMLLLLLDEITEQVKSYSLCNYNKNSPCIIHCAYETSGHSPNSQHYKGNAADFHFSNIPPFKTYETIIKVLKDTQTENFVGLGVYPDWINPGFHLDARGEKARWSRINDVYKSINDGLNKL
ncbi:MAG TPA: hypothetical protein P5556_03020 [Candidatus Gastranaerophilales bacterium]|nr:hypothetical protein [Candidatus Gastranaerophilales bacterium]